MKVVCTPGLLCRTAIRPCSGVLKKSDDMTLCSPSAQPACNKYIHVINHNTILLQLYYIHSSTMPLYATVAPTFGPNEYMIYKEIRKKVNQVE